MRGPDLDIANLSKIRVKSSLKIKSHNSQIVCFFSLSKTYVEFAAYSFAKDCACCWKIECSVGFSVAEIKFMRIIWKEFLLELCTSPLTFKQASVQTHTHKHRTIWTGSFECVCVCKPIIVQNQWWIHIRFKQLQAHFECSCKPASVCSLRYSVYERPNERTNTYTHRHT